MSTLQSRLLWARKKAKQSQKAVADAVGISQPTYSDLEKGISRSSTKLVEIAVFLGVSPEWLASDRGEPEARESVNVTAGNAVPIGPNNYDMPLISWVKAGAWCESPDQFAPGDAEDWLPRPKGAGPRAFALRVEGDSMTSQFPGQRSYPAGSIIYVDPDREITNGCRVVARIPSNGEYTFKVYTEDAGRRYLKPINPQYPLIDITEETHVCGVVIGSYLPE